MPELVRTVVRTVWSDGGQRVARRNAWTAMSADAKRSRERAEAAAVMNAAVETHELRVAARSAAHG